MECSAFNGNLKIISILSTSKLPKHSLVALFVITFIVMVVTGRVTQFVLERKEKKKC